MHVAFKGFRNPQTMSMFQSHDRHTLNAVALRDLHKGSTVDLGEMQTFSHEGKPTLALPMQHAGEAHYLLVEDISAEAYEMVGWWRTAKSRAENEQGTYGVRKASASAKTRLEKDITVLVKNYCTAPAHA